MKNVYFLGVQLKLFVTFFPCKFRRRCLTFLRFLTTSRVFRSWTIKGISLDSLFPWTSRHHLYAWWTQDGPNELSPQRPSTFSVFLWNPKIIFRFINLYVVSSNFNWFACNYVVLYAYKFKTFGTRVGRYRHASRPKRRIRSRWFAFALVNACGVNFAKKKNVILREWDKRERAQPILSRKTLRFETVTGFVCATLKLISTATRSRKTLHRSNACNHVPHLPVVVVFPPTGPTSTFLYSNNSNFG